MWRTSLPRQPVTCIFMHLFVRLRVANAGWDGAWKRREWLTDWLMGEKEDPLSCSALLGASLGDWSMNSNVSKMLPLASSQQCSALSRCELYSLYLWKTFIGISNWPSHRSWSVCLHFKCSWGGLSNYSVFVLLCLSQGIVCISHWLSFKHGTQYFSQALPKARKKK